MNLLWELFVTFFKIGMFTFGGGYAMIPLMEHECVEKHGWITEDEMLNITVIAESTPGPIALNCATYVGYKKKGFPGAVVTTLAVIIPSIAVIYLIARLLDNVLEIPVIANAFRGIKLAVGILILNAGLKMLKKMQKKPFPLITMGCAALYMLAAELSGRHLSTIVLMLAAGLVSLALFMMKANGRGRGAEK